MIQLPLHIVSFDIPYPPTYGGVMDVYFKMKALKELGVDIILHSFQYNRPQAKELEEVCHEIHYYDRLPASRAFPIGKPHIVKSRQHPALLQRLLQDDIPILFEGLHTTYYLADPDFAHRKLLVRMHNVEWEYYQHLARQERSMWKRQYFLAESKLLKSWESVLSHADHILTISPSDTAHYQQLFEGVDYLPAFHPYSEVESKPGRGDYCLYHGNLGVIENEQAVYYLIREVFADLSMPLVIAGSNPGESLIRLISAYDHISLRHNPSEPEMEELLTNAHIHVLPTFQDTGIKLKLLTSLHKGRFVVVNDPMVKNTGLEFGTRICRSSAEFRETITELWEQEFTGIDLAQRDAALGQTFSKQDNAMKLIELVRTAKRY